MYRTVMVVGMHRSGTSVLAAILQGMGVDMGQDAYGQTPYNPTGHFEDRDALDLNLRILESAGGSWHHPPTKDRIAAVGKTFAAEIERVYRPTPTGARGFKDPRLCLTIDLIYPSLVDPIVVVCRREKEAIARSLHARNGIPLDKGMELCDRYEASLESFFANRSSVRKVELHYRDLLTRPVSVIRVLAGSLGIDLTDGRVAELSRLVIPRSELRELRRKQMWKAATRKPWTIPRFLYRRSGAALRRLIARVVG